MAQLGPVRASLGTVGSQVVLPAVAVGAAYALRLAAGPVLGERSPFLLFVLPVLVSVLTSGRLAGFVAGFLALLAGLSFIPAAERLSAQAAVQALMFVLVCGGIGWLSERRAGRRREAATAAEQLSLLLEGATEYAIFMVDPRGHVTTWGKGAERLYGWAADEARGRHCSMFSNEPDAVGLTTAELDRACREGRFTAEMWQVRSDGSEFLADLMITPIVDERGELRGFAKVVHDVTDRRAGEQALEKREQHLRSILATVPDAMIVIDEKGEISSFSPAAEHLFGYSQNEVLGRKSAC